jgi:hypothetical protein
VNRTLKTIELKHVRLMPKELTPGVLYVAEEFGVAAHMCACGCGSKVTTPLDSTEWALEETESGPTLRPSIGNWQLACQSHYWIERGRIVWAPKWTAKQIAAGRRLEEERRRAHYEPRNGKRGSLARRLWGWVKELLER